MCTPIRASLAAVVAAAAVAGCQAPQSETTRFGSDLHEHPARCGMPEYTWVDDDTLGDVVEREAIRAYERKTFSDLFETMRDSGAAVVDRAPKYRAFLDRFAYVTQDKGALTNATGMYAWPVDDDGNVPGDKGALPLILLTHGTTGYADACAPSAIAVDNPLGPDALMASALASLGFIVVAPDYLGMRSLGDPSDAPHPYLVGEPTAIAALDAARAAYKLAEHDGVTPGPLFIAGASQGGHAAAMAVRYQPHYAAELEPKGALYLVPPLNLVGHARRVLSADVDATTLGNMGAVLMGHASWFGVDLATILQPQWVQSVLEQTAGVCALPSIDAPLDEVLTPDALRAVTGDGEGFDFDPWSCMLQESSLVETSVPRLEQLPALDVTGQIDPLVDAAIERAGDEKLCAAGMKLELVECEGRDHAGAVEASINQIFDFIDARISGAPLEDACVVKPAQICASDPRASHDR